MSLFVDCDDQQQVDHLFERLHEGGQRSRRAVRSSSAAAHARVVFAHHHPEHARSQAVCKTSISGSNPDGASNSTLNPERAVCWLASRRVKSGRRLHLPEQGFYAWRRGPESTHTRRDRRLRVENQGKRHGRPNLACAGRRKRRDEGSNPGCGNGLNVIAVDRVVRQGRADAPRRPVVDENPHQRTWRRDEAAGGKLQHGLCTLTALVSPRVHGYLPIERRAVAFEQAPRPVTGHLRRDTLRRRRALWPVAMLLRPVWPV